MMHMPSVINDPAANPTEGVPPGATTRTYFSLEQLKEMGPRKRARLRAEALAMGETDLWMPYQICLVANVGDLAYRRWRRQARRAVGEANKRVAFPEPVDHVVHGKVRVDLFPVGKVRRWLTLTDRLTAAGVAKRPQHYGAPRGGVPGPRTPHLDPTGALSRALREEGLVQGADFHVRSRVLAGERRVWRCFVSKPSIAARIVAAEEQVMGRAATYGHRFRIIEHSDTIVRIVAADE